MNSQRPPIPPGVVSTIRGRWQAPALTWVTRVLLVAGVVSVLLPGSARVAVATGVVAAIVVVPLVRVGWLVFRWVQEGDRRFVIIGVSLLGVVGAGAVISALGLGR